MVSWRAARREAAKTRLGRDVVLHEFAHKIDMRDGVLDGTPLLVPTTADASAGSTCAPPTTTPSGTATAGAILRSYAGTNAAEFFAVVTETFFTRPVDLAERKPELYDVFADVLQPGPGGRARAIAAKPGGRLVAGATRASSSAAARDQRVASQRTRCHDVWLTHR